MQPLNIPVLQVQANTLAQAYEDALIKLYHYGTRIGTQYDKPEDPKSIDATMNITIFDPVADPMIHKAFPGGIDALKEYVMELEGVKDHWVKNMNDPDDTRWEYTYHGRLKEWGTWNTLINGESVKVGGMNLLYTEAIDQIETVVNKLCDNPNTRQAQMITWMPNLDLDCYDPPCLQSLWYRILIDEDGQYWLNCNVRFRSNDAWGANFMNMFGFIQFNQNIVAAKIAEKTGKVVKLGRLNWHADSYHIYGKDIETAEKLLFNRLDSTTFEQRIYNFYDDMIQEMYNDAEEVVLKKIEEHDKR
jgi:thymidylate synthase